jgi:DNA-directed RNA polymerase specialized sigma24 family protein
VDPERRPFITAEAEILEAAMHAAATEVGSPSARRDALQQCLNGMPEARGRQALNLRYGEGLAGERAARRLALTPNAFYTLLSRVRKYLLECVERRLRIDEG